MPKVPKISDAEWEVMQIVWDEHPILASTVVERLAEKTDWSARTVKTMLGRLVSKGALAFKEQGNRYLYRPKVSREACLRHASQSFLERVFAGEPGSLLMHFVEHADLSADDLDELKRILAEKRRK